MKILRYLGFLIGAAILAFAAFLLYSTFTRFNPPQKLVLSENSMPDIICSDSTLSILSWNIGYAGLGDDMDFFYDGGKRVRDSFDRTYENLTSIHRELKQNSSNTFIFLQEIDLHSRRSYFMNELDTILNQENYYPAYAPNYVVKYVPIPPASPMGEVNSGIVNLSKYLPKTSVRYGYPGQFGWPKRLFYLRRCMLVNRYPTYSGHDLVMINSHMSAFDKGEMKKQEMQYLKDFVLAEYAKGSYVVVGGDWNQSPPEFKLNQFSSNLPEDHFKLSNVEANFMPDTWKWVYDPETPTNRYLIDAYLPGKTPACLIDFFLVSPNVEILSTRTLKLNFRNSDHNPITMRFKLLD